MQPHSASRPPQGHLSSAIAAALETAEALGGDPLIVPIPNTDPQRYLCLGEREETIEALLTKSWEEFDFEKAQSMVGGFDRTPVSARKGQ